MSENDISLLYAIIDTLNGIQVSGYENMSRIIGSINTLQEIIQRNTGVKKDG